MKKLLIFALIVLFSFCLFSQEEKKPDFRKAFWGMSQADVKKLESEKIEGESNDGLMYNDRVFGINCIVGYLFIKDKLYKGVYDFSAPLNAHSNSSDYLNDFETIKSKLNEKYGIPKKDKTIWKDELYKDKPSDWGTAVSAGQLVRFCEWGKPGSIITLQIFGDNFEISLRLDYEHPDYEKLKEAADKEKEKDKI